MTVDEALAYVQSVRPIVAPNEAFLSQLKQYEVELLASGIITSANSNHNHDNNDATIVTNDNISASTSVSANVSANVCASVSANASVCAADKTNGNDHGVISTVEMPPNLVLVSESPAAVSFAEEKEEETLSGKVVQPIDDHLVRKKLIETNTLSEGFKTSTSETIDNQNTVASTKRKREIDCIDNEEVY